MTDLKKVARKSSFGDGWFSAININKADEKTADIMTDPTINDDEREQKLKVPYDQYKNEGIPKRHKILRESLPDYNPNGNSSENNFSGKESMNGTSKYMQMFDKSHKPEFNILLKPENKINTSEIMAATKFSNYDSNDRDLNKLLNGKINSWYNTKYSTEPIKRDATGRQIEPEEKFKDTDDIIAPKTREGLDLGESLKRVSQHMSVVDDDDTPETGVNALQKSINRLGVQPPLKEDGVLGPKTALQTRMFLANNGYDTLDKAFSNRLYRRNT